MMEIRVKKKYFRIYFVYNFDRNYNYSRCDCNWYSKYFIEYVCSYRNFGDQMILIFGNVCIYCSFYVIDLIFINNNV